MARMVSDAVAAQRASIRFISRALNGVRKIATTPLGAATSPAQVAM